MSQQASITRAVFLTMVYEAGLILQYYLIGPIFYILMDKAFTSVTPISAEASAQMTSIHQTFLYGYPSLTVFGMIAGAVALWIYARRTYYASGTVWAQ